MASFSLARSLTSESVASCLFARSSASLTVWAILPSTYDREVGSHSGQAAKAAVEVASQGGGSEGGGSEGGGGGRRGGDSGDGCGGKQALDELLNVRPSLHGFSMEPLRSHLQAAQPLLPLDAARWRAAPLAPPTCVYRCDMRAPSEIPPSTSELQPAAASSVSALPPASWYELTADASGVATAVVLWTQL